MLGLFAFVPYDLQGAVDAALRAGSHTVTLPKGEVGLGARDVALELRGVKDLTIDGAGTTLVIPRPDASLAVFARCEGVTLRGFTVRHETPSMTQGWIRTISPDKGTYEVEFMPGFLASKESLPEGLVGYVFDPKTLNWRKGSLDLYFKRATFLDGRRVRLEVGGAVDHAVSVGDLMAFRGKGRTEILFDDCARTRVDGVTLTSAPGFGIQESGGAGGDSFRYNVLRGAAPKGSPMPPLLSANADAFHSNGVRKGPRVEGCRFEWMPDDGIPIHGYYEGVAGVGPKRLVITNQWPSEAFGAGDRVRVYAKGGASLRGEAKVVAIRSLTSFVVPPSPYPPLRDKPFQFELTLDREIPATAVDDLVANADRQGDGFVVRGNTIRNNRARGMLITASHGTIEDNVIDGSTMAGIVLCPELYWMQADFSQDVTIRGNTIRNVGYATVGPWTDQVGGIVVTAEVEKGRPQRDIRIQDNLLAGIYGNGIVVRHAEGIVLKGNRFTNAREAVNGAGRDRGLPSKGERFVEDAEVRG